MADTSYFGRIRVVGRRISALIAARGALMLVIALAALRGTLYAIVLPAWDYNDEEQHFDYVKRLGEEWRLPVAGATYLSPEILISASETGRWEHLRLSRPPILDVREVGLEGYSYEAYQPPLYYLLLAVPYKALTAADAMFSGTEIRGSVATSVLGTLYGLRLLTVLVAIATAGAIYLFLRIVFRSDQNMAAFGALLLSFIPERTMASSRVNNDSLLELFAVLVLITLLRHAAHPSPRKALLLGTSFGLALLTKLSAIALVIPIAISLAWEAVARRDATWLLRTAGLIILPPALLTGWFFGRNVWLYHDPTGAAAFLRVAGFTAKYTFTSMLGELAPALWMTRWEGIVPQAVSALIALLSATSLVGLFKVILLAGSAHANLRYRVILLLVAVTSWLVPLWWGVRTGVVQHVEGRFVIGAYAPFIAILLIGLKNALPARLLRLVISVLLAVLVVSDAAYIALFSVPYYYSTQLADLSPIFAVKPGFISQGFALAVVLCYALAAALALLWTNRQNPAHS